MSAKLELLYRKFQLELDKKAFLLQAAKKKLYQEQARFLQIEQYVDEYSAHLNQVSDEHIRHTTALNLHLFIEQLNQIKLQQTQVRDQLLQETAQLQQKFNQAYKKHKTFRNYLDDLKKAQALEKMRVAQRNQDNLVTDWYNNNKPTSDAH